jgi:predicted nucleic acid-binding protein
MAVVADTTCLVDAARGHKGALSLLDRFAEEGELVLVPSIVIAEYLAGSRDAASDLANLGAAADLQPFTIEDAASAGAMARRALKDGAFPGWMDVLIAGFALNRGDLAVVTRNPKHFPKSLGY